ncbi:hypothetical protein B0H14DRAFT_3642495 [Mycena olivaceomarginata]|nr:hypothetical protein B0H14DRAFT_3642495 [Mycena olivaceomarginata]
MPSNNENVNPSHYREHTRQQDGCTVLAPPPEPAGEQPPPYTPAAAPQAAAPVDVAATGMCKYPCVYRLTFRRARTLLSFEIPINGNLIGATPVSYTKKYGRSVPFATAYVEICTMMGIDHSTAALGYKWDNERANVPIHGLDNATDWKNCLDSGIGQTARARTCQNLTQVPPTSTPCQAVRDLWTTFWNTSVIVTAYEQYKKQQAVVVQI